MPEVVLPKLLGETMGKLLEEAFWRVADGRAVPNGVTMSDAVERFVSDVMIRKTMLVAIGAFIFGALWLILHDISGTR